MPTLGQSGNRLTGYVAGGYFVVKPGIGRARATYDPQLLPERIASADRNGCQFIPETWCIEWAAPDDEDTIRAYAAEFGLNGWSEIERLSEWATARFDQAFGWPNVCFSLETCQWLVREFLPNNDEVMIFGIAIPQNAWFDSLQAAEPPQASTDYAPIARGGIATMLARGERPEPDGTTLGFEPILIEGGIQHSWLDQGFELSVFQKLGIRPNTYGLVDTYEEVQACIDLIRQLDNPTRATESFVPSPFQKSGSWHTTLLIQYEP